MKMLITTFWLLLLFQFSYGQNAVLRGKVYNPINNESVPFATIVIQGTSIGAVTDIDGNYELKDFEPGLYNLEVSCIGYERKLVYEVQTFANRPIFLNIDLQENSKLLSEVEITASSFVKKEEAPVSMRSIGVSEIERNPGGNRDISRVIQSLPGVASPPTFRNDIIIRGGAPNENRFYLDGIEVPNINHFATQGASGGPVGLINVNFIREVEFYSSAFPADRGNALSSVFDFYLKDGNPDKFKRNITIGSSDYGFTFDGPLSKNTTMIFSARRSYLQFLFSALKLPFLPIYNDSQVKIKTKINQKNEITWIGLGAIDQFDLNQKANEGVTDKETLERNQYILGYIPFNTQWNYTAGANYKHFANKSFQQIVVSRNHLNNRAVKYFNNDETISSNKILDYHSQEIENKVRIEHTWRYNGWKWNAGALYEYANYTNRTFNKIVLSDGKTLTIDFNSKLNISKYGVFSQISKALADNKILLSAGIRTDGCSFDQETRNMLSHISPRVSASVVIAHNLSINASMGRYYQLPPYTVLGYRDQFGNLVNKTNKVDYIQANHFVAGFEYLPGSNIKISIEGFYKDYSRYPFLVRDSIALANLGSDFGVIGNEPVSSSAKGRAYGVEFLTQQKLTKGFYGILAVTIVRSEFEDKHGALIPSAWDNGQILTLTGGKKFKKDIELGVKFRFLGAAPYTPYNLELSALKSNWDVKGTGVIDYNQLNSKRTGSFNQLDVRLDKRWFLNKLSVDLYIDVQNVYNYQTKLAPYVDVVRDANGLAASDSTDPTKYQLKQIENFSGTLLPSIGLIIEF